MTVSIGYKSSETTAIFSLGSIRFIYLKKNNKKSTKKKKLSSFLNMPSRELNLFEDHNELNKNVYYVKKSSEFSTIKPIKTQLRIKLI